jgi:hypothetical protein
MSKKKKNDSIESLFQDSFNSDTKPKRPNKSKKSLGIFGGFIVLSLMAAILGLLAAGIFVLYDPGVVGMGWLDDLTATSDSIHLTEEALQATAHRNNENAINIESTRIVLDSWQRQMDQDSTQAALSGVASQTAAAIANAEQATQAALDYDSTATQIALDYYSTQAAINRNATALAPTATPKS